MEFTADLRSKLQLARTTNLGPKGIAQLLRRYASAALALENSADWLRPNHQLATAAQLDEELTQLAKSGAWLMSSDDADYPTALRELPVSPFLLTGLGNRAALNQRMVAMVGNRAASATGLEWARSTATTLANSGVTVCSGLARGIDTAAHQGALQSENPLATIAVVAGGLGHIYPPENATLRAQIITRGAVITEHPWGMPPHATLFPQRNRIIAGLSLGVVVSEATRHSGSLITAEYALEFGREVFAVPGSPAEARSSGPNWLLKQGATLIESAADILSQLPQTAAPYVKRFRAQPTLFPEEEHRATDDLLTSDDVETHVPPARTRLFALLGSTPTTFDVLLRQTGLSEAEAGALLTELELEGHAVREADGRWRRN